MKRNFSLLIFLGIISVSVFLTLTKWPDQPKINSATKSKIDLVLEQEKLTENQIQTFNSLTCAYLAANQIEDEEEKRYAIANNLIKFADEIRASEEANHPFGLPDSEKNEIDTWISLANRLVK